MGWVKLSKRRPAATTLSAESPDQALARARKQVREDRRRRESALLHQPKPAAPSRRATAI